MVSCVTVQFNPLLGEGLLLMGRVAAPVDPVECTFEGSSSSSTCINGPGLGAIVRSLQIGLAIIYWYNKTSAGSNGFNFGFLA